MLSRIRNICNDLIPPDFQPSGINYIRLPDALRTLCNTFEKRTGIECNITIHDNSEKTFLALTRRDNEIVSLVKQSLTNQQIAKMLGLSNRTVENHLQSIYEKTGVTSREKLINL